MTGLGKMKFADLLRQTFFAPQAAARYLISLQLPRQGMWLTLALISVLNGIVFSISIRLSPPVNPADPVFLPPAFQSPVLFTMFLLGGLVVTVFVLHWLGKSMGGTAELSDILVLITWLQVLRLLLMLILTVLIPVAPALSQILAFVASLWGVYILISFIDEAHRFGSWTKAAGVIILAAVGVSMGMVVILLVIGAVAMGVS